VERMVAALFVKAKVRAKVVQFVKVEKDYARSDS